MQREVICRSWSAQAAGENVPVSVCLSQAYCRFRDRWGWSALLLVWPVCPEGPVFFLCPQMHMKANSSSCLLFLHMSSTMKSGPSASLCFVAHSYQCDCSDTGFEGDHCELDILECASEPCLNNATCVEGIKNYSCACWTGKFEIYFIYQPLTILQQRARAQLPCWSSKDLTTIQHGPVWSFVIQNNEATTASPSTDHPGSDEPLRWEMHPDLQL